MKSIKILAASLIVSMVAATSFTVPAYAADTACTVQQPTAGTTQKASAAEDKLFTDFDKLVKNLETMYAKNTIKAIYLSDITKSLIQIEKQINTGIKDTAKLSNLLIKAEKTVKGLDLDKSGLQKAGDVRVERINCLNKIADIKRNKKLKIQKAVNDKETIVHGIKVLYGRHTYDCQNQKEYDFVMQKIEEAKQKNNGRFSEITWDKIQKYRNGTAIGREKAVVESRYPKAILDLPEKELKYHLVIFGIRRTLAEMGTKVSDGNSAYTYLVGGGDCNAVANITSAVYDTLGFNTRTVYNGTHAWCEVLIDGVWYSTDYGLTLRDIPRTILAEPTY